MSLPGSESEHVDVAGPEDAPAVVFVHGTVFNRTMWAPQREALAGEFRVLVPDLPGHGARTDDPFRIETAVETLTRVIDDLADGSAHVVGLSLGGYAATALARRHPERVDDLVLSGSSANPVGHLGTASDILGRVTLRAAESGLVERATDWLAERYVRSRDLDPETVAEIIGAGFDLRPFGEAGVEIAGVDFRAALASFPGPVLVLNGQWDLLMRLGEHAHADAHGDARVRTVDGAGHVANLDRPGAYASAIGGFLTSTVDASASD